MITDIPYAKTYALCPVAEPSKFVAIGDARIICNESLSNLTFSQLLINEVARFMSEDDVIGIGGVNGERCLIIVKQTEKDINKLIDDALNVLLKQHLENENADLSDIFGGIADWGNLQEDTKV